MPTENESYPEQRQPTAYSAKFEETIREVQEAILAPVRDMQRKGGAR